MGQLTGAKVEIARRDTPLELVMMFLFLVSLAAVAAAATAATLPTTRWFSQSLDHFDPSDGTRWQHRYLTNADHWDGSGALPNG
jgi:hypothetical protein